MTSLINLMKFVNITYCARFMRFVFFLSFFLFSSCVVKKSNPAWIAGQCNIVSFLLNIQEKYRIFLDGFGGYTPDGKVKRLRASLYIYENVDFERSREFIIEAIDTFLSTINQDADLSNYLYHAPFTYEDIGISIGFYKPGGGFVENGYIAHVFLRDGRVGYSIFDQEMDDLKRIHTEPYLEALEKVKRKNEENLLSTADPS